MELRNEGTTPRPIFGGHSIATQSLGHALIGNASEGFPRYRAKRHQPTHQKHENERRDLFEYVIYHQRRTVRRLPVEFCDQPIPFV